jgi:hypothetical protein
VFTTDRLTAELFVKTQRGSAAAEPLRTFFRVRREGGGFYFGQDYYVVRRESSISASVL